MIDVDEIWRYQGGESMSPGSVFGVAAAADNSVFLLGVHGEYHKGFAAVKLDTNGDFLWEWQEGSESKIGFLSASAVVDGVVGSGSFSGTWNGVTSSGGADFAVVKLYSNGTVAWRWQEGTAEDDKLSTCTETEDGNVVVAGSTLGSWNDNNSDSMDAIAAKLNVDDGEVIWRYQNGTSGEGNATIEGIAARGDGSVVLGGTAFKSLASIYPGDDTTTEFLAIAIDEDGNELWRWQDGPGTGYSIVRDVAAFDDGSVLLVGLTEGNWAGHNFGKSDFVITKLSASGNPEWYWQWGTAHDEEFRGATVGIDGSVVMSGLTFGSWAASQGGDATDPDFAAMSIDAEANVLWAYQAGTSSSERFNRIAVRSDGAIILGGMTSDIWAPPDGSHHYTDFAAVLLNTTTTSTTSPAPNLILPPIVRREVSPSESPIGLIIGSSVGGVALIMILIAYFVCRWRRDKGYIIVPTVASDSAVATRQGSNITGD